MPLSDSVNQRNSLVLPRLDVNTASDDDSVNDNGSVVSTVSGSTIYEDAGNWNINSISYAEEWKRKFLKMRLQFVILHFIRAAFGDELDQNELFEDKLSEAIEGMSEKSVQSRVSNIESVTAALMKKFIPDFVNRR